MRLKAQRLLDLDLAIKQKKFDDLIRKDRQPMREVTAQKVAHLESCYSEKGGGREKAPATRALYC
jgi:hypothetical protein